MTHMRDQLFESSLHTEDFAVCQICHPLVCDWQTFDCPVCEYFEIECSGLVNLLLCPKHIFLFSTTARIVVPYVE